MKGNSNFIRKRGILGFRTGKTWKKILAVLIYLFLALGTVATMNTSVNTPYAPCS